MATVATVGVHGVALASEWSHYAGNQGGQQYSDLDQIDARNVADLEIAWQYRSGELERRSEFHNATAKVQVNPILLPADGRRTPGLVLAVQSPDRARPCHRHGTVGDRSDVRIGGYATATIPRA